VRRAGNEGNVRRTHDSSDYLVGPAQVAGQQRTPRTPVRALLPLLPSGPGGVRRDDVARGVVQSV